jgi:hypothetical protein
VKSHSFCFYTGFRVPVAQTICLVYEAGVRPLVKRVAGAIADPVLQAEPTGASVHHRTPA